MRRMADGALSGGGSVVCSLEGIKTPPLEEKNFTLARVSHNCVTDERRMLDH